MWPGHRVELFHLPPSKLSRVESFSYIFRHLHKQHNRFLKTVKVSREDRLRWLMYFQQGNCGVQVAQVAVKFRPVEPNVNVAFLFCLYLIKFHEFPFTTDCGCGKSKHLHCIIIYDTLELNSTSSLIILGDYQNCFNILVYCATFSPQY